MHNEYQVLGPPGTGKTTALSSWIVQAAEKYGPEHLFVASFTRAAASELVSRDLPIPDERIGTLHRHCFHALGEPEIAEGKIKEWNAYINEPGWTLSGGKVSMEDEGDIGTVDAEHGAGDELMSDVQRYRARRIPHSLWPDHIEVFWRRWEQWKRETGYVDFTDLIERSLEASEFAPGAPEVGFFDEVQDFTALELALVRHWAKGMDHIVLAGDDDQCHPGDEHILTSRGYQTIDSLSADDRLVAWDRFGGGEIRRRGYQFVRASRPYVGQMISITTGSGCHTRVTPNHRLYVRWNGQREYLVYLQRRGSAWRVGTTRFNRSNGSRTGMFGLSSRARLEGADAAWLLNAFSSADEARMYEDEVSTRYGISKLVFNAASLTMALTQDQVDAHHERVSTWSRGIDCLSDHGLSEQYPLWIPNDKRQKLGLNSTFEIYAANINPTAMLVPVDNGSIMPGWDAFTREDYTYSGDVYSLSVEPHRNYIANGVIVGNCLYSFKGANPDAFMLDQMDAEHRRVLEQSYRVPVAAWEYASRWITQLSHREQKDYLPREYRGRVVQETVTMFDADVLADQAEQAMENGKSIMFLGSCSRHVDPIKSALRAGGIPFQNKYRRSRGDWNPLARKRRSVSSAERFLAYLCAPGLMSEDRVWTADELRAWSELVQADKVFAHGGKKAIQAFPREQPLTRDRLESVFRSDVLDAALKKDDRWLRSVLLKTKEKALEFPLRVYDRGGIARLQVEPKVTIGTIHSVKGGESDTVVVFPDLSMPGYGEWMDGAEGRDSVVRMMYVAFTRARENLVLCDAATRYSVDWLS